MWMIEYLLTLLSFSNLHNISPSSLPSVPWSHQTLCWIMVLAFVIPSSWSFLLQMFAHGGNVFTSFRVPGSKKRSCEVAPLPPTLFLGTPLCRLPLQSHFVNIYWYVFLFLVWFPRNGKMAKPKLPISYSCAKYLTQCTPCGSPSLWVYWTRAQMA